MIQNFKIDQAATFEGVRFWSCEPKAAFGDQYRQEATKDGTPKWELQLAATFRRFGRPENEFIKVGVAAEHNPAETIALGTPVQLVDFEIGVMEKTKRDPNTGEEKVIGAQVWYRCQEIRPIAATANGSGSKARAGTPSDEAVS